MPAACRILTFRQLGQAPLLMSRQAPSSAMLTINRLFTETSSSGDGITPIVTTATGSTRRKRQRHRFDNIDQVPSFEKFQQDQQTRALYRQFMRLIYRVPSGGKEEMLLQVRRQFRQANTPGEMSAWDVKRAQSEASKRLKELRTMLGNVVDSQTHSSSSTSTVSSSTSSQSTSQSTAAAETSSRNDDNDDKPIPKSWPWQEATKRPSKPPSYPKKTL